MEENVVFARVDWIKSYQSTVTGEPGPIGGGKCSLKNLGKKDNFLINADGRAHGYLQLEVERKRSISSELAGARKQLQSRSSPGFSSFSLLPIQYGKTLTNLLWSAGTGTPSRRIAEDRKSPLFRTTRGRSSELTASSKISHKSFTDLSALFFQVLHRSAFPSFALPHLVSVIRFDEILVERHYSLRCRSRS